MSASRPPVALAETALAVAGVGLAVSASAAVAVASASLASVQAVLVAAIAWVRTAFVAAGSLSVQPTYQSSRLRHLCRRHRGRHSAPEQSRWLRGIHHPQGWWCPPSSPAELFDSQRTQVYMRPKGTAGPEVILLWQVGRSGRRCPVETRPARRVERTGRTRSARPPEDHCREMPGVSLLRRKESKKEKK